jgi:hypothetical protein
MPAVGTLASAGNQTTVRRRFAPTAQETVVVAVRLAGSLLPGAWRRTRNSPNRASGSGVCCEESSKEQHKTVPDGSSRSGGKKGVAVWAKTRLGLRKLPKKNQVRWPGGLEVPVDSSQRWMDSLAPLTGRSTPMRALDGERSKGARFQAERLGGKAWLRRRNAPQNACRSATHRHSKTAGRT